jgi:hypothetical protein
MKVDASLLETNELIAPLTRPEKDALMDLAIGRSYEAGETIFE